MPIKLSDYLQIVNFRPHLALYLDTHKMWVANFRTYKREIVGTRTDDNSWTSLIGFGNTPKEALDDLCQKVYKKTLEWGTATGRQTLVAPKIINDLG